MKTNTTKFTGIPDVYNQDVQGVEKESTTNSTGFGRSTVLLFALVLSVMAIVMPAAAYTPQYTPVPFGCVTAQMPDQIGLTGDFFQVALNIVVTNWLTLFMVVVSVMLIVWSALS